MSSRENSDSEEEAKYSDDSADEGRQSIMSGSAQIPRDETPISELLGVQENQKQKNLDGGQKSNIEFNQGEKQRVNNGQFHKMDRQSYSEVLERNKQELVFSAQAQKIQENTQLGVNKSHIQLLNESIKQPESSQIHFSVIQNSENFELKDSQYSQLTHQVERSDTVELRQSIPEHKIQANYQQRVQEQIQPIEREEQIQDRDIEVKQNLQNQREEEHRWEEENQEVGGQIIQNTDQNKDAQVWQSAVSDLSTQLIRQAQRENNGDKGNYLNVLEKTNSHVQAKVSLVQVQLPEEEEQDLRETVQANQYHQIQAKQRENIEVIQQDEAENVSDTRYIQNLKESLRASQGGFRQQIQIIENAVEQAQIPLSLSVKYGDEELRVIEEKGVDGDVLDQNEKIQNLQDSLRSSKHVFNQQIQNIQNAVKVNDGDHIPAQIKSHESNLPIIEEKNILEGANIQEIEKIEDLRYDLRLSESALRSEIKKLENALEPAQIERINNEEEVDLPYISQLPGIQSKQWVSREIQQQGDQLGEQIQAQVKGQIAQEVKEIVQDLQVEKQLIILNIQEVRQLQNLGNDQVILNKIEAEIQENQILLQEASEKVRQIAGNLDENAVDEISHGLEAVKSNLEHKYQMQVQELRGEIESHRQQQSIDHQLQEKVEQIHGQLVAIEQKLVQQASNIPKVSDVENEKDAVIDGLRQHKDQIEQKLGDWNRQRLRQNKQQQQQQQRELQRVEQNVPELLQAAQQIKIIGQRSDLQGNQKELERELFQSEFQRAEPKAQVVSLGRPVDGSQEQIVYVARQVSAQFENGDQKHESRKPLPTRPLREEKISTKNESCKCEIM